MSTRRLKPFDVFVLVYEDNEFQCVLVSREYFEDVEIAKIYALSSFGFSDNDVAVVMDQNSVFHYHHPKFNVWFKGLKDRQLKRYFSWLVSK